MSKRTELFAETTRLLALNIREIAGPGMHPELARAFALTPDWLDRDDVQTSWCGIIMGLITTRLQLGLPIAHYRAKSWLQWGEAVTSGEVMKGDVIVMTRPGGHHVTVFAGWADATKKRFRARGGNQSNAYNETVYDATLIQAVRRAA